ncbi:MAG TPA: aminotransferase class III-fold pyridoxal phosphate-dependent enzyme, partial [Gemmatimonadales bacterium]|nr:aminotransferase class III-fold pyridoxal phosphate-dependent enzyme [Gemmatimonadales bacterium]
VEPDILLTAKGLGSGMPIGAFIARDSISTWESGSHGSTFGGNPVCCAAALATLDLVEGELMANAVRMGDRLIAGLRNLEAKHACIGEVRGQGLMVGVEFVKNRRTREPAPELLDSLVLNAFQRGLLLLGAGKSTLRLAPPLVVDEGDVDTALAIIDGLLGELD